MKTYLMFCFVLLATTVLLTACGESTTVEDAHGNHDHKGESGHHAGHDHGERAEKEVHLSEKQFQLLGMKIDTLPQRNMVEYVETSGQLEVPPQSEAAVTASYGGNIVSIKVIEGDKVSKGQVLAHLAHPNLVTLQTEYISHLSELKYLEIEYQRQRRLYEEQVGSGKVFQKTEAEFRSTEARLKGYEAQLRLMNLNLEKLRNGEIYEEVPIVSPISGYIRRVAVKTGQYVDSQTELFEIVNIDQIHADFMVFEKDMHKVKEGQRIRFSVESVQDQELKANIYSVGKAFEKEPKAIHLHAEIESRVGLLIPGMYIRGRIMVDDVRTFALPEDGLVREGDKHFMFTSQQGHGAVDWVFKPVEVATGVRDEGWVEVRLLQDLPKKSKVAWNNAYYLLAELKKGEAGHDH